MPVSVRVSGTWKEDKTGILDGRRVIGERVWDGEGGRRPKPPGWVVDNPNRGGFSGGLLSNGVSGETLTQRVDVLVVFEVLRRNIKQNHSKYQTLRNTSEHWSGGGPALSNFNGHCAVSKESSYERNHLRAGAFLSEG